MARLDERVALVDRKKIGLNAHIFAQVKFNAHRRTNVDQFAETIRSFPEVRDAYKRFFFHRLSKLPGVQEINSTVTLFERKTTTAPPIR